MKTYIYRLIDPLTNETRYIGRTTNPQQRLRAHMGSEGSCKSKREWLQSLKAQGQRPIMEVFDVFVGESPYSSASLLEAYHAEAHTFAGASLLNSARVGGVRWYRKVMPLRYLQHVRPSRVTHSAACQPCPIDRAPGFRVTRIEQHPSIRSRAKAA